MDGSCFLKTLGFPELKRPDGRPFKIKVRKHLALLIYLAVDYRSSHRREELVELLWGDVTLERGRHSLSVALSVLRAALEPDAIEATTTHLRLAATALTLDIDLLTQGRILTGPASLPIEVDRFLLDFEIIDAPEFQHWRDRQQAQLFPTIQAGILTLADHARRSGDMAGMMMYAERLIALDALSEEGIKAKVQALAMQGDRVSALRAYEGWKEELNRQLGAAPSELLEGIAARLRRPSLERPIAVRAPSVQTDHWADRSFVGRAGEFRALSEAWESTTQLNTRHVLITGETGIGKSTLAMRFGTSAALEGAAVARVQCFELEQRIAFGMIGALVSSLLDRPGVLATAPESLAEIARVIPRVRERFTNLPKPRQTEGEAARLHFAEGTFALFDSIMEEQPLVLIVDDYPRSDEASLAVLHMLLRRVGADRLMVVLTGRPPEPDESAQAKRIRNGLAYLPMRHLELPPLTEEESDQMLGGVLKNTGKEPASPIRRAILLAGGGNPMALDLLGQDWVAHGDVALAVSLPAMRSDMPASAMEAVGFDRLIERMLPALAPRTRSALYLSAILGPRLNDIDYFGIVDLTSARAMAELFELVTRRILRDTDNGLEFTNELVRARLYLKIPSAVRTRLHDGVAVRLLAAVATGESIPGLEVAWHCIRARRRDEATPFLMSGARGAIVHGAPDEAARALSTALGHLRGRAKDEATLLLTEAYGEMGEWRSALESINELSSDHKTDDYLSEMAHALGQETRWALGYFSFEQLTGVARELLARARSNRHPLARLKAVSTCTSIAGELRSDSILEVAMGLLQDLHSSESDLRSQSQLLLAKGVVQYHRRLGGKGRAEALAGAQLLAEAGATDSTFVKLHIGLGAIACVEGRYAEGIGPLETAYNAAERLDNSELLAMAAANMSICYYRLGSPREQLKWGEIAARWSKFVRPGSYERVPAIANQSLALIALGRTEEATHAYERLKEARESVQIAWIRQAAMLYEADILWLLGTKKSALDIVNSTLEEDEGPLAIGFVGKFARWMSVLLVKADRVDELVGRLRAHYELLSRYDLIDQVEILCSMRFVQACTGADMPDVDGQTRSLLARLPSACSHQLREFGLLLPD